MTDVGSCSNQFCLIFSTRICLVSHGNYWVISWLPRHILGENIRQNWLEQEPTSVITVSNYWVISWLTRHILVENIRQNWLEQEPTSVITVSNYWAQWLLTGMTDVSSCPNQFCLVFSTRIRLVSHDITQ
jgi:hypothetical protein